MNTHYERKYVDKPTKNSGELITEQAGYIPPQKQIEAMIAAGVRLAESRMNAYDFKEGEFDENASAPFRHPKTDMAEVSMAQQVVAANLKASKAAQDQRIAEQKALNDKKAMESKENAQKQS